MEITRPALEFLDQQAREAHGPHYPVELFLKPGQRPQIILGKEEKLTDVEHLFPGRARFRGELATTSLADFVAYTLRHSAGGIVSVFVDPETMSATAFFNLGNPASPGHADDRARLTLKASAAFLALLDLTVRPGRAPQPISQKALAEFLEDWREAITPFTGFDANGAYQASTVVKAIAAVRQVSIEAMQKRESAVGDLSATATSLESIEAKSQYTLPIALGFRCIPYDSLGGCVITVRVSVATGEKEPKFILRIVREGDVVESIAQEFKDELAKGLADKAALTVGVFKP